MKQFKFKTIAITTTIAIASTLLVFVLTTGQAMAQIQQQPTQIRPTPDQAKFLPPGAIVLSHLPAGIPVPQLNAKNMQDLQQQIQSLIQSELAQHKINCPSGSSHIEQCIVNSLPPNAR